MLTNLNALESFDDSASLSAPSSLSPANTDFDGTAMNTSAAPNTPDAGFERFSRLVGDTHHGPGKARLVRRIAKLGDRLGRTEPDQQAPLLQTLMDLGDRVGLDGDPVVIASLVGPLCHWLRRQRRLTPAYGKTCVLLQRLAVRLIRSHRLGDANRILMLFNHVYSGVLERDATLRAFTGDILKGFSSSAIIEELVTEFRTNAHNQWRDAGRSLVLLGAVGAAKILPALQESDDKFDRMRFLEIVAEMGPLAAQTLAAHLQDGGPWYFIRNLVQVLGRAGDESHGELLVSLLTHGDGRVRREALDAIYKVGGSRREELLLAALHGADDQLKIRAVAMLGNLRSGKALGPLLAMVGGRTRIWERSRRELDLAICHALGKIGAPEAIPVLVELAEKKRNWGRHANSRLAMAARHARDAIAATAQAGTDAGKGAIVTVDTAFEGMPPVVSRLQFPASGLPGEIKAAIGEHVQQGNAKAAVKLLYENVLERVRQGRFDEAEALRRAMITIDPLAFNAIVKSGARIDAARNAAIDPEHLAIWQTFYQGLSLTEANGFYYALKERSFAPGEALITQGRSCDCLYLINRGTVKNLFQRPGGAIQLNTLEGGDICGYETFFHHTVATTSLVAAEPVTASCLDRDALARLETTAPQIKPKLHDFCLRHLKRSDLWLRKSIDRRTQRRINLTAPVKLRLPDAQGRGLHVAFRGRLVDLSVGGALVRVRLSRDERTRMLVGHPVLLELETPLADIVSPARRDAVIVALRPHLLNEHFLQLQFIYKIKFNDFQAVEKLVASW